MNDHPVDSQHIVDMGFSSTLQRHGGLPRARRGRTSLGWMEWSRKPPMSEQILGYLEQASTLISLSPSATTLASKTCCGG